MNTPSRFQHLLGRAARNADALRDEQLAEVLARLGEEDAALTIGKIDHCQIGVFLSWRTTKGHALFEQALYLPERWTENAKR